MTKRKSDLSSIFQRTDQPKAAPTRMAAALPAEGRTVAVGVGLKQSEVDALDRICAEHEIARNALMRYAVRHFLKAYQAGEIDLSEMVETPVAKKRLRMP